MANSDFFTKVASNSATTLAAPGHNIGEATFNVGSTSAYPTTTGVFFAVDTFDVATGQRVPGSYTVWQGDVTNSTTFSNCVLRHGTDQNYTAGATTRVYSNVAAARENRLVDGLLVSHEQTGALKQSAVQAALGLTNLAGYTPLGQVPNTVTYNGNRSYTCVFNGVDVVTGVLSPGMRIRTTRTVAAPTQSTSLNGTNQYWSKTAPAGMTFTDDFTVSAWIKVTSYATGYILSRYNATNGWWFGLTSSGQLAIEGLNGAGNYSGMLTYQSVPLNKWVHITSQLDMSTFTATDTTSYMMVDGVNVPVSVVRGGTNPTALVQAGDLQVGARNGTGFFPGKIAQAAVFSGKLTQDTARSYYSQGLTGTEPTLVSAYSFNGNANDLNTTNANNLTSNNGVTATNADSPFGGQADGTISSTLDYGIIQRATFSTNSTIVFQVPEGCTVPTTGGVSSVVYSSNRTPYGFPGERNKWTIETLLRATLTGSYGATSQWFQTDFVLNVPLGKWDLTKMFTFQQSNSTSGILHSHSLLYNLTPVNGTKTYDFVDLLYNQASVGTGLMTHYRKLLVDQPTQGNWRVYVDVFTGGGSLSWSIRPDFGICQILAENAYL